jgi:hypothetical protein
VLGQPSFERGDPRFLLLDDGEQLDDRLAHDERGLLPTGGIQRKPGGQCKSSCHRTSLMLRNRRLDLQPAAI